MSEDQHIEPQLVDSIERNEYEISRVRAEIREFETLTLAEATVRFLKEPGHTWRLIHTVASTPRTPNVVSSSVTERPQSTVPANVSSNGDGVVEVGGDVSLVTPAADDFNGLMAVDTLSRQDEALILGFRLSAFLLAWAGNSIISTASSGNSTNVNRALVYIGIALVVWLMTEVYAFWQPLKRWVTSFSQSDPVDHENVPISQSEDKIVDSGVHPIRFMLAVVGMVSTFVAVIFTMGNNFTGLGFFAWMASIVAFSGALASEQTLFGRNRFRFNFPKFWRSWTFYALIVIVLAGAYFRIANLDRTPAQMTSDHVEKLLDAQRVLDGNPQVFFPNNGGREPFQMYLMAILSKFPGLGMNFYTLKLLSALEGIITLPMLWWMGREIVGKDNPQLGNVVGLVLAALVAVSQWHTSLSRLALRIVLTPFMASWLLIYLSRALRFNNRDDYLRAGLVLGAGLYMYQAVRMLPVIVIVGVGIAIISRVRDWSNLWRYVNNFLALVFISFIVFVPMFSFSLQFPDLFWRRATGRLLGDAVVEEMLADGSIVSRDATIQERLMAFQDNLPVLGTNIRDVVLMFNWKGDVAWINNAPNAPQMDTIVGALFLLGLAAWLARLIRRREMIDWLIPAMLFIMLMPSALSIAYPVENPSATRTSGALPVAFLIAAYPLALMLLSLYRIITIRVAAYVVSAMLVGLVMFGSYIQNANTYFNRYHTNYLLSSLPYKQAGTDLKTFNYAVGSQGNVFMIAYNYWWDHRALGIEGGMIDWPNGIVSVDSVPQFLYDSFLRGGKYTFDPDKDILFFHAVEDERALQLLRNWFPSGESITIYVDEQNRSYNLYRVPAVGMNAFTDFIRDYVEEVTTPVSALE